MCPGVDGVGGAVLVFMGQSEDQYRSLRELWCRWVRGLDGNPDTRVAGHPGPVTLVRGHFFLEGVHYFSRFFSLSLFSSLSLSLSFFLYTHSLGSFEFNQFHQSKL